MSEMKINNLNESGANYPFKVPEDYFENLTARIMDRIPEEETESTKIVQMKPHHSSWTKTLSIAASLLIVAIVSLKVITTDTTVTTSTSNPTFAQIDDQGIEEAELYSSMVDNYDIYTLLAENGDADYSE